MGDGGRAEGLFQMHPELRGKYGVGKESSPKAQTKAAAEEMRELLTKYGLTSANIVKAAKALPAKK